MGKRTNGRSARVEKHHRIERRGNNTASSRASDPAHSSSIRLANPVCATVPSDAVADTRRRFSRAWPTARQTLPPSRTERAARRCDRHARTTARMRVGHPVDRGRQKKGQDRNQETARWPRPDHRIPARYTKRTARRRAGHAPGASPHHECPRREQGEPGPEHALTPRKPTMVREKGHLP